MADCHNLFQSFHTNIQILSSKKSKLKEEKEKLREKIRVWFKENHPEYEPEFFIQGSYKMGSAIRTKDDTCDLDDGVYFLRKPEHSATTLQKWVLDAVDGAGSKQQHRKKCITIIYEKDGVEEFNIDIPVYYKIGDDCPNLAIKDEGWQESDPKEVVLWFQKKKKENAQVVKIVRYHKIWGDYVRNKMPSGLAFTILACNTMGDSIFDNLRDDITLRNVLTIVR